MPRTATAPVARPNFVPMPRTAPSAATPVVAHLRTPPPDALIEPHRHEWGQLICPQRGGLRITAGETSLIVPVFRAAWVPAGMSHEVAVLGEAQFYAVYMMSEVSPLPAERCLVLDVSPLLRDLAAAMAGGWRLTTLGTDSSHRCCSKNCGWRPRRRSTCACRTTGAFDRCARG